MEINRTGVAIGLGVCALVFAVSAQAANRAAELPPTLSAAPSNTPSTVSSADSSTAGAKPNPSTGSEAVNENPTPEAGATSDFESEMNAQVQRTRNFADTLIGMNIDEVETLAASKGFITRIVERDGESFIVTMDYRTNRVNLTVEKDIVTKVFIG